MSRCYVGVAPGCACWVAAAVDEPKYAKDNAKEIARWIRDGLTVQNMDTEEVRVKLGGCPKCCPHLFKKKDAEQVTLL